jgi:hypothetical protein
MSSFPPPGLSQFLSTLRTLPLWILAGITVVCLAVLYVPAFAGVQLGDFRQALGPYFWVGTVAFGILTTARTLDLAISIALASRSDHKVFAVPVDGRGWWGTTAQRDGSHVTQIRADLVVSNLMTGALVIVNARLVRPGASHEVLQTMIHVRSLHGSSPRNSVPAERMGDVGVVMMLRGKWQRPGSAIRATIALIDQYGREHRVRVPLKPFPQPIASTPPTEVRQRIA